MAHIDSTESMHKIMAAADMDLKPPKHVRMHKKDLPFFESIIAEFALFEWTDHQLELAALLARTMSDLETEQFKLRREGTVMKTDKGTPVVNPRKSAVQMYSGTILSMRKSLSIHARAKVGESRDAGKKRKQAKEIEAQAKTVLGDDLIARPSTH